MAFAKARVDLCSNTILFSIAYVYVGRREAEKKQQGPKETKLCNFFKNNKWRQKYYQSPSEICFLPRKKEDFSSVVDRLMAEPPITLGRATGEKCAGLCGLSYRAWIRAQPEAGVLVRCWSLMKDEKSWKNMMG